MMKILRCVKRASENYEIAISFCADVSDSNQMKNFHNNIIDEFGGVDVMYANAGVGGPAGPIDEIDHNEWKRCVEVNLFGAFYSASWASGIMKVQKMDALFLPHLLPDYLVFQIDLLMLQQSGVLLA